MAGRLLAFGLNAQLSGKLLHLLGILQQLFQFALEAVGAIHGAEQFPQAVASVEELPQGLDLFDDLRRLEVSDRGKLQLDGHFSAVAGEGIFDLHLNARGLSLIHI